ncbi:MAG: sigma-70 family RNA polymerase sigma factor [Planctomycetes bacterium]|nr:sigma-70 family RNA polymerase sigma factor [Planctomycetota bacterium]
MDDPATDTAAQRVARLLPHLDAFVGFARARVGDPALAADLVQDALTKALEHAHEIRDDERIEAWFYRVLRNTIADLGARRARSPVVDTGVDDLAARDEDRTVACACLSAVIADLDAPQRDAIRLVDLQGVPAAEAAAQLGISEGNLKVRRHRAREQLQRLLTSVCTLCAQHGCLDCQCRRSSPS